MLEIGSVIDGKYKILNVIGQGGMSVVYLAMNERANKQWAVKEIRKDGVRNFEVVKQGLIVETDLLKKLNHPNLPSIIDVIDGDGTFLIVMDYIEGNPLSKTLQDYGAQAQEDVVVWALQLCNVLGYLHSQPSPIIYRDMKPGNVMLKPDGNVMLIDFGTAREYKKDNLADTTCLGTQGYAAPEQFGGQGQTDARTDIYCLGATMYHLVTGHNPCEPPYEMYPIRQWNPALSSGLEKIIRKCTQRNPDDRYQSCAELHYALSHYSELDVENQRKQKRQWWSFVAVVCLTVVSAACMIGFRFAEDSQIKNSYDHYLGTAKDGNAAEAADTYSRAVNLVPERPEAYLAYYELALGDYDFSPEESNKLQQILQENNGSRLTNEAAFRNAAPEEFASFSYQMAIAYYYYYDKTGDKGRAMKWLEYAVAYDYGNPQKNGLVEQLYKIAGYYAGIGRTEDDLLGLAVGLQEYWNDLKRLTDGDLMKKTGQVIVTLGAYQELAYQIYTRAENFRDAGISKAELLEELDKVEKGLATVPASSQNAVNQIQTIRETIETAKKIIDSAYKRAS